MPLRPTSRASRRLASGAAVLIALLAAGLLAGVLAADRPPERIVAIGDVHGDADAFLALLRRTGLVDESRHWTGGRATLVQTGDVLDRGAQARDVLDLLMALEAEATAAGGAAVALMGNHEVMNALGMLRDVSPAAIAGFADSGSEERRVRAFDAHVAVAAARRAAITKAGASLPLPPVLAEPAREAWMAAHPPGWLEYLEAFGPSGKYGRWVRARRVAVRLDDTIFVHGGLDPDRAPESVDAATEQARQELARWDAMRAWMIDKGLAAASFTYAEVVDAGRAELARVAAETRGTEANASSGLPPAVLRHPVAELLAVDDWSLIDPRGPLWFRGFATWTSEEGKMGMEALQHRYGAVRFVVGHTPVRPPRQVARFGDRVFLIDTGISSVYRTDGGRPSALEIRDGIYTAVYLDTRTVLYDGH